MVNARNKSRMILPWVMMIFGWVTLAAAQTPITVSMQIYPPFSPYLSDWLNQPNKILVMLRSDSRTQTYQVRLGATITGDNGIKISTFPSYKPPNPIVVPPGLPVTVSASDLKLYFDVDHVTFEGITLKDIIYGDGLPEGNYMICVRAFDWATGAPLSSEEPSGCSTVFSILHIEPPTIVRPICNDTLTALTPQNILFNWTHPAEAPFDIEYTLKIIEVEPSSRNPNDAMNSATTPTFFEGSVLSTSFLYGPGQPLLTVGKRYAFRVTARDPQKRVVFKNGGASEVCVFTYGTGGSTLPVVIQRPPIAVVKNPPPKEKLKPSIPLYNAYNATVTGTLDYAFDIPGINTIVSPLQNQNVKPLKNTSVKLVIKYLIDDKSKNKKVVIPGFAPDNDQVLDIATSDNNGAFKFSFYISGEMGLVATNRRVSWGPVEFPTVYTGDVYRVARVVLVNSPYYLSPSQDIIIPQGQQINNLGNFIARVRNYQLTVTAKASAYPPDQASTAGGLLPGMIVYLLRQLPRPLGVPENEGRPRPVPPETLSTQIGKMEVIAKDITATNGKVVFTHAVININEVEPYYLWAKSKPDDKIRNYQAKRISFSYLEPHNSAVFADEYSSQNLNKTIELYPQAPRIAGRVVRYDAQNVAVAGAQVRLGGYEQGVYYRLGDPGKDYGSIETDNKGWFISDNLPVHYKGNQVVGPVYHLFVKKSPEYRDTVLILNGGQPLKPGGQVVLDPFSLTPAAKVKGIVADEDGNGVTCKVTVDDGPAITVTPQLQGSLNLVTHRLVFKNVPGSFESWATPGNNKIVIDAGASYLVTDTTILIKPGGGDLGTFKVYQAKHRVRIAVYDTNRKSIAGAHVSFDELGKEFITNASGAVEYAFLNADSSFKITVRGPEGQDYEAWSGKKKIPNSSHWTNISIALKKATFIKGNVYVGTVNEPVDSARVYLQQSSTGPKIETWTNTSGAYILHNVPISSNQAIVLRGAKSESNYIGDEKKFSNVPAAGLTGVDLHLKIYKEMDITHLMGFPIEVQSLTEIPDAVKITGSFVKLDSFANNQFKTRESTLSFKDLAIVPSKTESTVVFGNKVPVAKPQSLPLPTEQNEIQLKVYETFNGQLTDKTLGIELEADSSGRGVIKGKVSVLQSNFQFNGIGFSGGRFSLARVDASDPVQKLQIPAITASKNDPVNAPEGFLIVDSTGSALHYTLYAFDAEAGSSESFLFGDSVRLKTILHTELSNVTPPDLKLPVGDVVLHTAKLAPIGGTNIHSINLGGNWSINGDAWSLATNGWFSITTGKVKTGMVDVPFNNLQLTKTDLVSTAQTFQLKSLTLIDLVPLTVTGEPGFGFDPGIGGHGAWKLWVSTKSSSPSCAYLTALEGMADKDTVFINSLYLSSIGDEKFSLIPTHITIHKVADYQLNVLQTMKNYIEFQGTMNLSIPDMGIQTAQLMYINEDGQLKFALEPFWFKFATKGVVLDFPTDSIDGQGFRAHGTVSEAGKFSFKVTLSRSVDSTAVWVEPGQVLDISSGGARKLTGIDGAMRVENNAWQNFWFSGDLAGCPGASGQLRFTVTGDVVADNQQLGVTNIPTPFGGIGLTYDFANHRLWGHLDFSQGKELMGGSTIYGQADMLVDGDGWYFLGGGSLNLSGFSGTVGILFGNYPQTPAIVNSFVPYSVYYQRKGSFPPSFPSPVNGFYFEGALQVPVIPDIDADFVVVHGYAYVHLGGDIHLGMNFTDANTYGAGLYFYGEAGAGLGASAILFCAGASGSILVDFALDGQYQSDGSWFVDGDASLELGVSAYAGVGTGCDSDCESICCSWDCPFALCCVKDDWSGSVGLGLKVHIGSDGTSVSPYRK